MQSTHLSSFVVALTSQERSALVQEGKLQSLNAVFATIPDPRSCHGRRYPLAFLLTCLVAALLCNSNSLDAVAQWCREHRSLLRRLFPEQRFLTPSGSLLRRLLPRLDPDQVEWRLTGWIQQDLGTDEPLAFDGKTVLGSGAAQGTPIHLLSVSTHESGQTLLQVEVAQKTNEIPVAQAVLPLLPVADRVCTADALHTHRALCQLIRDQGGDYLLFVKENEPHLHHALAWHFDDPLPSDRSAQTRERHRGRIERRSIRVTSALSAYLTDWPGLQQQAELTRTVQRQGQVHEETVYLITSLTERQAGPDRLLALARGQWSIESRHWIRDYVFGEDRSCLRTGHGPQIMAAFRNLAISLIRRQGTRQITATRRHFAAHPRKALRLLLSSRRSHR
jgi:predicted transposase YbfD/YdcC